MPREPDGKEMFLDMNQYLEKAREIIFCKHDKKVMLADTNILWCPDCGGIKDGAVWTPAKVVETVRSIASIFGLKAS